MDEEPDAPRCSHCNTPCHEEPNCYFGAKMENRPPKWALPETQQKLIDEHKNPTIPLTNETQNLRPRRIQTNRATPPSSEIAGKTKLSR